MGPLFVQDDRPSYHANLLLVKMQSMSSPAQGVGLGQIAAMFSPSPPLASGMSALSYFERAGLVRKVTPISSRRTRFTKEFSQADAESARFLSSVPRGQRTVAALSATAFATNDGGRHDTSSVVELDRSVDLRELQKALANDPSVAAVSRIPLRYLAVRTTKPKGDPASGIGMATAPPSASTMWNLNAIRWAQARSVSKYKEPVRIKVGVLDTGIDDAHPDLKNQIKSYTFAYPDLAGAYSAQDIIGHGTHVAGTIAAAINNQFGINGICECEVHAWKIFDDEPDLQEYNDGTASYVYYVDPVLYRRALLECADSDMDVVNLSIGGPGKPDHEEAASFASLIQGGTTVIAAMGNERQYGSRTSYPAAIEGVVAVGATNLQDRITNFSNRGNHITLCAPGDAIWSTLPTYAGQTGWTAVRDTSGTWRESKPQKREIDYDAWPGTSMASPHVAAAAALFLANGGPRDPASVHKALVQCADKVSGMKGQNFDSDYGFGRLNLERLVEIAQKWK